MKNLLFILLCFLLACTNTPSSSEATTIAEPETPTASVPEVSSEIPASGTYAYDFASEESGGQSNGGKLQVTIKGNQIEIVYLGGSGMGIPEGEVLDGGLLVKHSSGKWIVAEKASDKDLEQIGDCTGGPAVIDFEAKKYFWC
ncbi:MAG: hypothetical protein AAF206_01950 [Bacteroidota bacterium]